MLFRSPLVTRGLAADPDDRPTTGHLLGALRHPSAAAATTPHPARPPEVPTMPWMLAPPEGSEDPTLTANLASQYVDGLQGQTRHGVLPRSAHGYYQAIATLKHYAANNDEDNRLTGNSQMDQRTLREYYTAQFASIIAQSHPGSIMSAYNEVNGTPAAASVQLMQTLDRKSVV